MAPNTRTSTKKQTEASRTATAADRLKKKLRTGKARLHRIPGPIQTALLGIHPPPLKVPSLETLYLRTESLSAQIHELQRKNRALTKELRKLKGKVEELEDASEPAEDLHPSAIHPGAYVEVPSWFNNNN